MAQLHALTAKMQQFEEIEKARQLSQNLAASTTTTSGKEKSTAPVAQIAMDVDENDRNEWEDEWDE